MSLRPNCKLFGASVLAVAALAVGGAPSAEAITQNPPVTRQFSGTATASLGKLANG